MDEALTTEDGEHTSFPDLKFTLSFRSSRFGVGSDMVPIWSVVVGCAKRPAREALTFVQRHEES